MKVKVKRALVSVSDKSGIVEFAKSLEESGVEIISTGGTYGKLAESGIRVKKVEEVTGFPEMMDGRVKTLHPVIHAGILADRQKEKHMEEIRQAGILPIDMVVVNLYPFKQTISKTGVTLEQAIENIDIGGPTMIRSAAKNYRGVAVVVDPADYRIISEEMKKNDSCLETDTLFRLSVKAFQHTCEYDSVIFNHFYPITEKTGRTEVTIRPGLEIETGKSSAKAQGNFPAAGPGGDGGTLTGEIELKYQKVQDLRYGENPHQRASYYRSPEAGSESFVNARQLQGKELSYNNILDGNAAFAIIREFSAPCVAVIKHNNPCGAAIGNSIEEAYRRAYDCDPLSAFGSIVASNMTWTEQAARFMIDKYVEVVIAPGFEAGALKVMEEKKNLRVLQLDFDLNAHISTLKKQGFKTGKFDIKSVDGGLLVQDLDEGIDLRDEMKVVTEKGISGKQWEDLIFGWQIAKNVKSNAIVLVRDRATTGVGAGQMSRIDAAKIAVEKSGGKCMGSVMASDAFFPQTDVVELANGKGIAAIIQPGGSVMDSEVIAACNRYGIPMVFTGKRHFKH
ncbi:MAG: bifunctional phosphoribosylaminoimidazolecarboxamide formyltransferase/IMP cyclohydrolase [Actinobacteria bacterium]|nr:bifunctional phosphoribosylaminoimidazolecarboxamide formyltransferase/IMP cyclohydrolase [Actinomycetota bacterium]